MKYRIRSVLLFVLPLVLLAGCDIAADVRLQQDPIGGGGDSLDPEQPGNVAVFFYTDRPVYGLKFLCLNGSAVVRESKTDKNGMAVCSRTNRISFFIGDTAGEIFELGRIDMGIYGDSDSSTRRNYIPVTASTLRGTTTDYDSREVTNTFNLLYTLDEVDAGSGRDVVSLSEDLHDALSDRLATAGLALFTDPATFASRITDLAEDIQAEVPGIVFVNAGDPLSSSELKDYVNRAIVASRAGIYTSPSTLLYADSTSRKIYRPGMLAMATRSGVVKGIGFSHLIDSNVDPAASTWKLTELQPGARLTAGGLLYTRETETTGVDYVEFQTEAGDFVSRWSGRLVNDIIYANIDRLDPVVNSLIPYTYEPPPVPEEDVGVIKAGTPAQIAADNPDYEGGLAVIRGEITLPDIDLSVSYLDVTPVELDDVLPLNLRLTLRGYDEGFLTPEASRADSVNHWEIPPVPTLDITIQRNGEIVSDLDADCESVEEDGAGVVTDEGLDTEYVIGQVGAVFEDGNDAYVTILLAVLDSGHPAYGLTLGMHTMYSTDTSGNPDTYEKPVVYDVGNNELRTKDCGPTEDDCALPEWFNNVVYTKQVQGPIIAAGSAATSEPKRRSDYLGPVSGVSVRTCP